MSQGLSVVYIVEPRYAEAGSLPEFSRAQISPYEASVCFLLHGGGLESLGQRMKMPVSMRSVCGIRWHRAMTKYI